jgi:hypothetical protein
MGRHNHRKRSHIQGIFLPVRQENRLKIRERIETIALVSFVRQSFPARGTGCEWRNEKN